jgi:hypothetical protein
MVGRALLRNPPNKKNVEYGLLQVSLLTPTIRKWKSEENVK